VDDSCHVHSSSPLFASDHVQEAGYSKSKVETDAALQLETARPNANGNGHMLLGRMQMVHVQVQQ
jgi:hypothetical protein